ncbi:MULTISPECIES: hypothetical protein [unclassified Massilia]|uniref:hypothetical protein n=1 Tax=unclassified Massilia TaxID=2609279 RepID=UPI001780C6E5|nr:MULTISPECIES: hypothetical protein [unclassified Massilia]MBD8528902.1 hypothetical protein [Massilia sp. CFBP 13647]MBD8673544.1 hypothetical protein [Massilia sp. CFBP 13721]
MVTLPFGAHAQRVPDVEKEKAKLVYRLYQATYGAQQRCGASAGASHGETLVRFRAAYPELVGLLDASPYLAQARDRYTALQDSGALPQLDNAGLRRECEGLEAILRALIDAQGSAEAAAGYVDLLKK